MKDKFIESIKDGLGKEAADKFKYLKGDQDKFKKVFSKFLKSISEFNSAAVYLELRKFIDWLGIKAPILKTSYDKSVDLVRQNTKDGKTSEKGMENEIKNMINNASKYKNPSYT